MNSAITMVANGYAYSEMISAFPLLNPEIRCSAIESILPRMPFTIAGEKHLLRNPLILVCSGGSRKFTQCCLICVSEFIFS